MFRMEPIKLTRVFASCFVAAVLLIANPAWARDPSAIQQNANQREWIIDILYGDPEAGDLIELPAQGASEVSAVRLEKPKPAPSADGRFAKTSWFRDTLRRLGVF